MTEKEVFEFIKIDKTPYWSLYVVTGFSRRHVGSFNLEGMSDLPEEEKLQKSIQALKHRLDLLSNESNFLIKLKKTLKSNQDSIFEYQFTTNQTAQNLSGVPQNYEAIGMLPTSIIDKEKDLIQSTLNGQMNAMRKENELRLKKLMNEYEVKRKLDLLSSKEKEIKDLKQKYESKKELITDSLGTILEKTINKFFGDDLAGLTEGDTEEVPGDDERAAELEKIANDLYNSDLTIDEIKQKISQNAKNSNTEKENTGTEE